MKMCSLQFVILSPVYANIVSSLIINICSNIENIVRYFSGVGVHCVP